MNKLKKLFHKSLHLNQLISWLSFYAEHLDYLRKKYPKRLSVVDLKNLKSSDTLYILGCGASIKNLTESDWALINRNDSLALNLWYKSTFVPNFWMWEPPRDKKVRDDEFSGMQKLLNDKSCYTILKNWQNLYSYYSTGEAKELVRKFDSVVMMRRSHIYNPNQMSQLRTYIKSAHFHFYRGSLFLAIIIARLMGYTFEVIASFDDDPRSFIKMEELRGNHRQEATILGKAFCEGFDMYRQTETRVQTQKNESFKIIIAPSSSSTSSIRSHLVSAESRGWLRETADVLVRAGRR